MSTSLYDSTLPQFAKTLKNLNSIIAKAVTHSELKKFDISVLLNSRLAPDQLNFITQIQIACDTAKLCASRLTEKPAPVHADKETTLSDISARIHDVINYLGSFSAKDFVGSETRKITQPRWENKWMTGEDYVLHHVIPNFYFHITTAYSILRHNGVDIGKKDYLGELPFKTN